MGSTNRWIAKWIWTEGEPSPRNFYLYFRKAFVLPPRTKSASLRITADSRYVLFLNGERLGQGPVRSWPFEQSYDRYDIGARLKRGRNVVAVLVQHFGVSTFQYIVGRGALLCQIDLVLGNGRTKSIGTDGSWRVRPSASYSRRVSRMACQQAWAESYDARNEFIGWNGMDFSDAKWRKAKIIGPVGIEPWTKLVEREIPFLTEEPILPKALIRKRVVRPPRYHWSVDLRPNLLPGYFDANPKGFTALLVTIVRTKAAAEAKLKHVQGPWTSSGGAVRLNGRDVEIKDRTGTLELQQGDNLLMIDVTGSYHEWTTSIVIDTEATLQFVSPLNGSGHWATVGLFPSRDEGFASVWACRSPSDLRAHKDQVKPVLLDHESEVDVFALTTNQQPIGEEEVRLEDEYGLFSDSENAATLYPAASGDVELLLDFGKEIVGFLEFELEASEGAVLDWNMFEFMKDQDIQFTGGLNNTVRYVATGGFQTFHSIVRRGFRYALLTIRNIRAPVKIRKVQCLLNTFPVAERGDFLCSDPLLNEIWRMCRYTTRLCMEDTFVDCPAYEQTFWVGDSRGEALINYVAFGERSMPRRCWKLVAQSLRRSPLTESQVPSGWKNVLTAWSLLWVLACDDYYLWSGDKEFLVQVYSAIAEMCRNLEARLNDKGLLEIEAWNMLDWAPMDTPGSGVVTHQNALMVRALRTTAHIARILDKDGEAQHYIEVANALKHAINEHLWSDEAEGYIDSIHADDQRSKVISQQTNAVVLLCECATPDRERTLMSRILDVPKGWVEVGSPFAMFFLFELWAKTGNFNAILDETRKRWGFMLDVGTTTCWETFGTPGAKQFTRSYCHAWSAGPAYFLSLYQLGVRPASAGMKKVLIAPEPVDLKWARGRMPTPHGEVEVSWERTGEEFHLSARLPREVSAKVVLPVSAREYPSIDMIGVGILGKSIDDGKWAIELSEGGMVVCSARRETHSEH